MADPLTEDVQDEDSDDLISSISILEKHAESDLFFTRQKVARGLPDTLRAIFDRREDVNAVVAVMCRLAHDPDPNVRVELINQVPHLAVLCRQWQEHLGLLVRQHLVPLLVDAFADGFPAVRKSSHNAFLILLEHNLVEQALLEEWLCPLVAMHTIEGEEERRLESLTLMCKMATLIGRDLTEKFFRWQYLSLCDHPSLAVRKACAVKMDEMCAILGTPSTETHLLPKFLRLCADKEWEVRKACAEAFTAVSWMCSLHTRHNILAPCFLKFLRDPTMQVKVAAYQSLGPFIYTFGDPTPFSYPLDPCQTQDMNLDQTEVPNFRYIANLAEDVSFEEKRFWEMHTLFPTQHFHSAFESSQSPPRSKAELNSRIEDNFNSFQFWQVPLPDIREMLPLLPQAPEKSKVCVVKPNNHRPLGRVAQHLLREEGHLVVSRSVEERLEQTREALARVTLSTTQSSSIKPNELSMNSIGIIPLAAPQDPSLHFSPKDVVPPALLEHYLSMADPLCKINGLEEHCAFSLAAVAMALGPDSWPQLRPTCHLLSGDVQWQVRRSLAASLHELAAILGPALAAQDLLPTFCTFVQDMDEVRIGLMEHLTDFIRVLSIGDRKSILPHLPKFLKMDNENNWRYRMAFAHQMMMVSELYPSQDIKTFILPIALSLVGDKVSAVRLAAVKLMAILLRTLSNNNAYEKSFFAELGTIFRDSSKWSLRQMYVFLCDELVNERALPLEQLAGEVAPNVILLSWDQVANVRLAVTRWLSRSLPVLAHLALADRDLLLRALAHLDLDHDSDVQYIMARFPPALLQHVPSPPEMCLDSQIANRASCKRLYSKRS